MNVERSTRFAPNGPSPTFTPQQKRPDNWLDALQAYWKIDPETRDAFWSLFDSDEEPMSAVERLAPSSQEEASEYIEQMANGYDPELAKSLGYSSTVSSDYDPMKLQWYGLIPEQATETVPEQVSETIPEQVTETKPWIKPDGIYVRGMPDDEKEFSDAFAEAVKRSKNGGIGRIVF